jgi:hypothetical protein
MAYGVNTVAKAPSEASMPTSPDDADATGEAIGRDDKVLCVCPDRQLACTEGS